LAAGIVFSIVGTIVMAWWPIDTLWNRVYSPYQLLEIGTDSDTGLTLIRAAGHYYQHVRDFSGHNAEDDRGYYDFPYAAHPVLTDVAIVGSGTGKRLRSQRQCYGRCYDNAAKDSITIEATALRTVPPPIEIEFGDSAGAFIVAFGPGCGVVHEKRLHRFSAGIPV
jgi:hypothetical protein